MKPTEDLVEDYLRRLREALKELPRDRRRELEEEIREHIELSRSQLGSEDEAEVRSLLDRIGDPSEIAADSQDRLGIRPHRTGLMEVAAIVLLPFGGVVLPALGWVVGVILLWSSRLWNVRDKLIGTFLLPGGLLLPVYLALFRGGAEESCMGVEEGSRAFTSTCSVTWNLLGIHVGHTTHLVAVVMLFVIPFATAIYLAIRLGRKRP